MKYAEMEIKKCEKCGKNVRGRKLCPHCTMLKNGWVNRNVYLKKEEMPAGMSVQAIFDLGLAEAIKKNPLAQCANTEQEDSNKGGHK